MRIRNMRVGVLVVASVIILLGAVWTQHYSEQWFRWQELDRVHADEGCCTNSTMRAVCQGWYEELAGVIDDGGDLGRRATKLADGCPGAQEWFHREELTDVQRMCGWTFPMEERVEAARRVAAAGGLVEAALDGQCRKEGRVAALQLLELDFDDACGPGACLELLRTMARDVPQAKAALARHADAVVPVILATGPRLADRNLELLGWAGVSKSGVIEDLLRGSPPRARRFTAPNLDERTAVATKLVVRWLAEQEAEPGASLATLWLMAWGEMLPTATGIARALEQVPCEHVAELLIPLPLDSDQRPIVAESLRAQCPNEPLKSQYIHRRGQGRGRLTVADVLAVDEDDPEALLCAPVGDPAERRGGATQLAAWGGLLPLLAKGSKHCSAAGREAAGEILGRGWATICAEEDCSAALEGLGGTKVQADLLLAHPERLRSWLDARASDRRGLQVVSTLLGRGLGGATPMSSRTGWPDLLAQAATRPVPELAARIPKQSAPPDGVEAVADTLMMSAGLERDLGALILRAHFGRDTVDVATFERLVKPLSCDGARGFEEAAAAWGGTFTAVLAAAVGDCP